MPSVTTHQIFDNAEDLFPRSLSILLIARDGDDALVLLIAVWELHVDVVISSNLADHGPLPADDLGVMAGIHFHLELEALEGLENGNTQRYDHARGSTMVPTNFLLSVTTMLRGLNMVPTNLPQSTPKFTNFEDRFSFLADFQNQKIHHTFMPFASMDFFSLNNSLITIYPKMVFEARTTPSGSSPPPFLSGDTVQSNMVNIKLVGEVRKGWGGHRN